MARLSLDDILKWMFLVERFKAWFSGAKATPVGGTATVPEMVINIGKQRWRIPEREATRER